jgi:biopolymer transport protein ExbB
VSDEAISNNTGGTMLVKYKKIMWIMFLTAILLNMTLFAVSAAEKVEKYIPNVTQQEEGMTLWQVISSGGEVMIVLALLSVAAFALVLYYFFTIKQDKLVPVEFLNKVNSMIQMGKFEEAKILCSNNDNLIAKIGLSGLEKRMQGSAVIEESVQDSGKRSVTSLWQKLSYLADIAAIAPMVGLLGTVLGMIQAFNVIAFQTGAVKPILLASGISKAMVTTAAGLIIAIPAMMFYSLFKGKLQSVTSQVEHIANELVQLLKVKGEK